MNAVRLVPAIVAVAAIGMSGAARCVRAAAPSAAKVRVTTSSEAARQAYLRGRDLVEKLRLTDGRASFARAAELDPAFALAYYGLANTAPTAGELFAALRKAVALADKASDGERRMILGLDAQVNGNPAEAQAQFTALAAAYPGDERAQNLLGNLHLARQEFEAAIEAYRKATSINPEFSQPYNQLGYALRALGRYDEAEAAFKRYVELIPNEPNPYDSYAEFLMKRGRFTESIEQYRKALALDRNFVPSYIGIANDQVFLGKPDAARETLATLAGIARNDGERRQAHLWTAVVYLHQGDSKSALAEIGRMAEIAKATNDRAAISGDLNLMGTVLLEGGEPDAALARYDASVAAMDASDASSGAKEAAHRNHLYDTARVALTRMDVAAAAAAASRYRAEAEAAKVPFEVRRAHELAGLVAAAKGEHAAAVAELGQADQQDPRVLFELGQSYAAVGRADDARKAFLRAADFNGLAFNYAFVRTKAQASLPHRPRTRGRRISTRS